MPIQINPATTFSTNINPRSTALAVPSILPPLTATVVFASIDLLINQAMPAISPVIATGGNGTYTFAITPALPAGLNFNTATGQITGTPSVVSSTATHTVTVTDSIENINGIDFLVVGGGGAGGHVGGGGAGGHQYFSSQSLILGTIYTVTVGLGGTASTSATGASGSPSVFDACTSAGGGGGAGEAALPAAGGSGGGGGGINGTSRNGAAGNTPSTSPSQGNAGGNGNDNGAGTAFAGGGGGGAGSGGFPASTVSAGGFGGLGTPNSITGTSVTRAAGGGGGGYQLGGTGSSGTGGSGIGGNGGRNGLNATGGSPNTGSGGGGNGLNASGNLQGSSGGGGSGVVIIRYPDVFSISNPGGGLGFTTDASSVAGYKITTFTVGTGSISFVGNGSIEQTSATFSLTVSPLPALTTTQAIPATTLTANTAATPFTPVTAAGGFGTLTFAVAPVLPAGLILSTATGQITGTPTATLTATNFTVTVTDAASQTSSKIFSLTVQAPAVQTTTTTSVVTLGISAGGTGQTNVSTFTQAITLSASNFTAGKRLIIILAGFRDSNGSYVNSRVPLTATATLGGLPLIKVSEGQSDYNSSGVFVGLLDLTGAQNLVLNFNPTTFSGGAGYVAYMIFDDVTYWNYVGGSGGIASATTSLGISAPSGLSELGQTVRIVGLNASNPASAPTFTPSDGFTYTTWFSQDNGTNEWSVGYYYIASSLTSAENAISGTMSGASAPQGFGYATADFKIYRIS